MTSYYIEQLSFKAKQATDIFNKRTGCLSLVLEVVQSGASRVDIDLRVVDRSRQLCVLLLLTCQNL